MLGTFQSKWKGPDPVPKSSNSLILNVMQQVEGDQQEEGFGVKNYMVMALKSKSVTPGENVNSSMPSAFPVLIIATTSSLVSPTPALSPQAV